ncbi:MAG: hypothetical protein R3F61_33055 [Myxococcota bacterium]
MLWLLLAAWADDAPARRFSVLPLPTIDVAPETGLAVGGVVLVTGHPFVDTRPSTFELEATITTRRQLILTTDWNVYTPNDRFLITGGFDLLRYPEDYWGIGSVTPESARERYSADRVEVDLAVLMRAIPSLYVGPVWKLQSMFRVRPDPEGELANGAVTGADGGVSSGLGATVVWDSREVPLRPAAGESYGSVRQLFFGRGTGSQFAFVRHEVDGRVYVGIGPTLLAFQGFAQLHGGDPPFRMLALLGGDTITRGYTRGRYRDKHLLAVQSELRFPIVWRFGGVVFAGAGEVVPNLADVSVAAIRPTAGGGLRLRVDEQGTNLRVDVAVGIDALGAYFSFGEAF